MVAVLSPGEALSIEALSKTTLVQKRHQADVGGSSEYAGRQVGDSLEKA